MARNKALLIIMDGVGVRESSEHNAFKTANTPNLDRYFSTCSYTTLVCHGRAVGLPDGVMGNSEVGHVNIGAGRVVMQDLVRIDSAFETGEIPKNPVLLKLVDRLKTSGGALHLMGLASDAGVHSDLRHMLKLIPILKELGLKQVYYHAIADGRDTPPNSGIGYLRKVQDFFKEQQFGRLASIVGRYYCMDRDKRWERVQLAYDCYTQGKATLTADPLAAVQEAYERKETDEFLKPILVDQGEGPQLLRDGDAVLALNFRADRMREIAIALNQPDFDGFERANRPQLTYVTMTRYQKDFPYEVLFDDEELSGLFGEVVSKAGMTQLRIAETEKYAHVTYFFNGGREEQYPGEERIMVPSPKVATYDLQPEMSAPIVTEKLREAIEQERFDVIVLNFANGDMVGHTGVEEAAIKAVETVDTMVGELVELFHAKGGTVVITADHGNSDEMWDYANQQPHTQHTLNPVPLVIVTPDDRRFQLRTDGRLSDITPTLLELLGLQQPTEMTGRSLILA